MDQLRTAMEWLRKNHFWVLVGLVAVVSAACWYVAAGQLQEEYKTNSEKITNTFSSTSAISSKPFHPNTDVNEKQEEQIVALSANVEALWRRLYERQREQVLKWPAALSDRFRTEVEGKSFGDEISPVNRANYQNYIQAYYPELPKIVDAKPAEGDASGGGRLGGGGRSPVRREEGGSGRGLSGRSGFGGDEMLEDTSTVLWEAEDQLRIKEQLDFTRTPESIQIWVAQEDLWVYETILRAIAATNKAAGADRRSNAAVRVIYQMQVGAPAATASQSGGAIWTPPNAAPAGGMADPNDRMAQMGSDPAAAGADRTMLREGGGRDGDVDRTAPEFLLGSRYIDDTGAPAPYVKGEYNFGREYKQLPVRLVLEIDTRFMSRLILELANAPMQVEAKVVRIGVDPSETAGGGRGGFRGGEGRGGADVSFETDLSRQGVQAFSRTPTVQPVVLVGTVYIFNEPDPAVLQSPGDETLMTQQ